MYLATAYDVIAYVMKTLKMTHVDTDMCQTGRAFHKHKR